MEPPDSDDPTLDLGSGIEIYPRSSGHNTGPLSNSDAQGAHDSLSTQAYIPSASPKDPRSSPNRYHFGVEIGEGGFGKVYLGTQLSPVKRQVAIKTAKVENPGAAQAVFARFRQEQQALAMLNHPSIAQLFDAGTTDTDEPFFVMEYVDGIPITKFCDSKQMSIRDRLLLFLQICDAVHHAHQKGIIHRDLTPKNILVTQKQGTLLPKVIDFGLAKVLDPLVMSSESSNVTWAGGGFGTPSYVSPEQAGVLPQAMDVRSDVYSLGIVLYELLTGTTPYSSHRQRFGASPDPFQAVGEIEAITPSASLKENSRGSNFDVFRSRSSHPKKLPKMVAGDLDRIVMGAIEKNPENRYGSVLELAEEVRHFLAVEPISRGPGTLSYKLGMLARKHRLIASAAAISLVSLVVGLVAVTGLWRTATISNAIIITKNSQLASASSALREANAKLEQSHNRLQQSNVQLEQANDQLETAEIILKSSITQLRETDQLKQEKIEQSSRLALQRGIDAWYQSNPQDAIAHWTSSLQLWPENGQARHWLNHGLLTYREQGWNPPYWVFGGDDATSKAILSQDGRFVALQSALDNRVTIVDTVGRSSLGESHQVLGLIDDIYWVDECDFQLLTVEYKAQQAIVWKVENDTIKQQAILQGEVNEGELEFSAGGKFLVRQLDQPKNTFAYRTTDGTKFTFAEDETTAFYLNSDDTAACVVKGSKMLVRDTRADSPGILREIEFPIFAQSLAEIPTPAPDPVEPTPPAPAPEPDAGVAPVPDAGVDNSTVRSIYVSTGQDVAVEPTPAPQFVNQQGPIIKGFRASGRPRAVVDGNRLRNSISSSSLIGMYPFNATTSVPTPVGSNTPGSSSTSSKLLVSSFDHEAGKVDLQLIELAGVSVSRFFESGNWSPLIFIEDDNRILSVTYLEYSGGGCSPGIPCSKDRYSLDLVWNDARYGHIKSPSFPVFDAVIDWQRPRALLISRPLPDARMQLFDFASAKSEPMNLSIPSAQSPSSRLESYFVGTSGDVVCRFGKNAVGVWATHADPIAQYEELPVEFSLGITITYETAVPAFESWILASNGNGMNEHAVKDYRTPTTPVGGPGSPVQWLSCLERNNRSVLGLFQQDQQSFLLKILDPDSFEPILETLFAWPVNTVNGATLEWPSTSLTGLQFSPNGDHMAVMGFRTETEHRESELPKATGDGAASILENSSVSVPIFGVYSMLDQQWKISMLDGSFSGFHPDRAECLVMQTDGSLNVLDFQSAEMTQLLPAKSMVAAVYSPVGDEIAVFSPKGELTQYSLTPAGLEQVAEPMKLSDIPPESSVQAIGYDNSGNKIWIQYSSYSSYYKNSPGCTECEVSKTPVEQFLQNLLVFELESGETSKFDSLIFANKEFVLASNRSELTGYWGLWEEASMTVPYSQGVYKWDEEIVMTVTQEHQGDAINLSHKVEFWNIKTGMPAAPSIRLSPQTQYYSPVLDFAIVQGAFRLFLALEDGSVRYLDVPRYGAGFEAGALADMEIDPLISFVGRRFSESGGLVPLDLPSQLSVLSHLQLEKRWQEDGATESSIEQRKLMLQLVGTATSFYSSQTTSVDSQAVNSQMSAIASMRSIVSPKIASSQFTGGFEFSDGLLLQTKSANRWLHVHKNSELVFELTSSESDDDMVRLLDAKRELVFRIPRAGGQSQIKSIRQDETAWKKWRDVTVIPTR